MGKKYATENQVRHVAVVPFTVAARFLAVFAHIAPLNALPNVERRLGILWIVYVILMTCVKLMSCVK